MHLGVKKSGPRPNTYIVPTIPPFYKYKFISKGIRENIDSQPSTYDIHIICKSTLQCARSCKIFIFHL